MQPAHHGPASSRRVVGQEELTCRGRRAVFTVKADGLRGPSDGGGRFHDACAARTANAASAFPIRSTNYVAFYSRPRLCRSTKHMTCYCALHPNEGCNLRPFAP